MRQLNASEFKAKCLSLLDDVARTGEPITITKRGKPVAQLVPAVPHLGGYPQEALKGTVHVHGDIVAPVVPPDTWESLAGA